MGDLGDQETESKSRDSERAAGFALGIASLGGRLPQGEFLSWDTNPVGIAARWFLHSVGSVTCPLTDARIAASVGDGWESQ